MARAKHGSKGRDEALSRERIVEAAIELLDAEGENGLTFRALATRLATGAGAIYWHVPNKSELLVAASNAVIARAMDALVPNAAPRETIRTVAVAVFEAIDAHPWVVAQLSRAPWETAMLQIVERIGQPIQALGVADDEQFTSATTLTNYITGVGSQNAANARLVVPFADRDAFLDTVASRWEELDAAAYPFARKVAAQLRRHDDRAEFLAGIDLILKGITARRRPRRG